MIKQGLVTLGFLAGAGFAHAEAMPESVVSVEAMGNNYVTFNVLSTDENQDYDYQVVRVEDIKRLVGSKRGKDCVLFYLSGGDMLKIPVTHQPCKAVAQELINAKQHK